MKSEPTLERYEKTLPIEHGQIKRNLQIKEKYTKIIQINHKIKTACTSEI